MRQNVGSENRLHSTRSFVLCSVLTDFYQARTVAMAASAGSDAIANRTLTSNCRYDELVSSASWFRTS